MNQDKTIPLVTIINRRINRDNDRAWIITINCPYCKKQHSHGSPVNTLEITTNRMAHCHKGNYDILL